MIGCGRPCNVLFLSLLHSPHYVSAVKHFLSLNIYIMISYFIVICEFSHWDLNCFYVECQTVICCSLHDFQVIFPSIRYRLYPQLFSLTNTILGTQRKENLTHKHEHIMAFAQIFTTIIECILVCREGDEIQPGLPRLYSKNR